MVRTYLLALLMLAVGQTTSIYCPTTVGKFNHRTFQLDVRIFVGHVTVCEWHGKMNTASMWLFCLDGHFGWIHHGWLFDRPTIWQASYGYNNQNYFMEVVETGRGGEVGLFGGAKCKPRAG